MACSQPTKPPQHPWSGFECIQACVHRRNLKLGWLEQPNKKLFCLHQLKARDVSRNTPSVLVGNAVSKRETTAKQIKRKVGHALKVHKLKQELPPATNFNLKATCHFR